MMIGKGMGGGIPKYEKRLLYYFRKTYENGGFLAGGFYKFMFRRLATSRGVELTTGTKIGKGLYLGHTYNITINPRAVIGDNCNIHKGVTIGQEFRGERAGTPIIGDEVWIGANATVVGKVKIGNDVLIAPNTFINCNVPSHSVVFGNPCIIKHKDYATEGYINHKV